MPRCLTRIDDDLARKLQRLLDDDAARSNGVCAPGNARKSCSPGKPSRTKYERLFEEVVSA